MYLLDNSNLHLTHLLLKDKHSVSAVNSALSLITSLFKFIISDLYISTLPLRLNHIPNALITPEIIATIIYIDMLKLSSSIAYNITGSSVTISFNSISV